jgi:hypothetical protein
MTDEATTAANVDRLAMLTTKLERESRATRYLLVICTAANIAVTTFGMKVAWEWLPPLLLAHFIEHMPEITMTYRAIDANLARQQGAPKGGATTTSTGTTGGTGK